MLKKGDQRRRDADQLIRRYVNHVDVRGNHRDKVSTLSYRNQLPDEASVGIHRLVGRGDHQVFLFNGCQKFDIRQDPTLLHHAVRRLNKSELIHPGVRAEGNDQPDIRSFRCLHGADSTVMGGMNIPHLKPGPFPCQAAGAQGGQSPLMGNLGQGIGLVHELRKLAAAEKLTDHCGHGLYIDEVMRHHGFDVLKAHFLLDRPFHAHQTDTVLVFDQLADGAHPPVTEVINVIHTAFRNPVFKVDEIFDGGHDVFVSQDRHVRGNIQVKLVVHLRPPDRGQIVAFVLKEEAVEKLLRRIGRRRIAWPQAAVDFDDGITGVLRPVNQQGVPYGGVCHILADLNDAELPDPLFPDRVNGCGSQRLIAAEDDLSRFRIQDIGRQNSSRQLLDLQRNPINMLLLDFLKIVLVMRLPFLNRTSPV